MKAKNKPICVVKADNSWKEVDFFLRIHRHLPNEICGSSVLGTFGNCFYRKDGVPINHANDYVDKLQKNPEFVKKEKEVEEAVKNGKPIYIGKVWNELEAFEKAMEASKDVEIDPLRP